MSNGSCARALALFAILITSPVFGGTILPYHFTIDAGASGLNAAISNQAVTDGTLIGNWNPDTNPTGTRTKPGLFGSFGEMENLPVPAGITFGLSGPVQSSTSGGFRMTFDLATGGLVLTNYAANFLASGNIVLPATATILFDSFRTRNPTSVYVGGLPVSLPLGDATVSALSVVQAGIDAPGVLTPMGGNRYGFTVGPLVILNATFSLLGNEFTIPSAPVPLLLEGQVTLNGATADLVSIQPIVFDNAFQPGVALPETPLDLPTILPPGDVAHLLLNLTLTEVSAGLDGTLTTQADGVLVPEPGILGLWLAGFVVVARRSSVSRRRMS